MKRIVKNAIKCNHCGDIIVSTYTNSPDDFTDMSEFEEDEKNPWLVNHILMVMVELAGCFFLESVWRMILCRLWLKKQIEMGIWRRWKSIEKKGLWICWTVYLKKSNNSILKSVSILYRVWMNVKFYFVYFLLRI